MRLKNNKWAMLTITERLFSWTSTRTPVICLSFLIDNSDDNDNHNEDNDNYNEDNDNHNEDNDNHNENNDNSDKSIKCRSNLNVCNM